MTEGQPPYPQRPLPSPGQAPVAYVSQESREQTGQWAPVQQPINQSQDGQSGQWTAIPQPVGPPQTGQWMAAPPRPRRQFPQGMLPGLLLTLTGIIVIVGSLLPFTVTTERLLDSTESWPNSHDARVNIVTLTGWSFTSTVPIPHLDQPIIGWGLVLAGFVAVVAGLLLLVERADWAWPRPLAGLAAGVVTGLVISSVLDSIETFANGYTDDSESIDSSAGAGFYLLVISFVLAIVAGILAMRRKRRYGQFGQFGPTGSA